MHLCIYKRIDLSVISMLSPSVFKCKMISSILMGLNKEVYSKEWVSIAFCCFLTTFSVMKPLVFKWWGQLEHPKEIQGNICKLHTEKPSIRWKSYFTYPGCDCECQPLCYHVTLYRKMLVWQEANRSLFLSCCCLFALTQCSSVPFLLCLPPLSVFIANQQFPCISHCCVAMVTLVESHL